MAKPKKYSEEWYRFYGDQWKIDKALADLASLSEHKQNMKLSMYKLAALFPTESTEETVTKRKLNTTINHFRRFVDYSESFWLDFWDEIYPGNIMFWAIHQKEEEEVLIKACTRLKTCIEKKGGSKFGFEYFLKIFGSQDDEALNIKLLKLKKLWD